MWCQFDSHNAPNGILSCGGPDEDTTRQENFNGRVALITGGGSGVGFAAAESLALKGFTVVILCRDKEKGDKAVNELRFRGKTQEAYLVHCDLESFSDIRRSAEEFRKRFGRLDVLINNAAINPFDYTQRKEISSGVEGSEGIELAFGVNYLSHFLLSLLLLDLLQSSYLNPPRELISSVVSSNAIIPSAIFNGENLSFSAATPTTRSTDDSHQVNEANPFGTEADALLPPDANPPPKSEKKKAKKQSSTSPVLKRKNQEDSLRLLKSWPTRIISICDNPQRLAELGDTCFDFNDLQLAKDNAWNSNLAVLRSKLALLYMTIELSSRVSPTKSSSSSRNSVYGGVPRVAVVALDPGQVLGTKYHENAGFMQKLSLRISGDSIENVSQAYVRLATAPLLFSDENSTPQQVLSGKLFDVDFEEEQFPVPNKETVRRLWDESCKLLSLDRDADVPLPGKY